MLKSLDNIKDPDTKGAAVRNEKSCDSPFFYLQSVVLTCAW